MKLSNWDKPISRATDMLCNGVNHLHPLREGANQYPAASSRHLHNSPTNPFMFHYKPKKIDSHKKHQDKTALHSGSTPPCQPLKSVMALIVEDRTQHSVVSL